MIFRWETEEERLKRSMKISPQKKLELLYDMNKFLSKFATRKARNIRNKLKGAF